MKARLRWMLGTRQRKITALLVVAALIAAVVWIAWPAPAPVPIASRDVQISAPGGPGVTDPVHQGTTNVSHGCINLSADNAQAYYESAIYGDPVEVTGTSIALSAADGDIYDWTIPWNQWLTMSSNPGVTS